MSSATLSATNGQGPTKLSAARESKNIGAIRQATPDSDAVVSSDDDHEPGAVMSMSLHSAKSMPLAQRPLRRPSWLSEVHSTQRKYSQSGVSLASTGGSQPPTPSAENGSTGKHVLSTTGAHGGTSNAGLTTVSSVQSWDNINSSPHMNPLTNQGRPGTGNSTGSTSFPWNSQLWQQSQPFQQSQKASIHASRLSASSIALDSPHSTQISHSHLISPTNTTYEDLRSPTSLSNPPEHYQTSSVSSLPFEIPLEPNRKTIRSQSYSSGVKRSALGRRTSRPGIFTMDTHDDISLHEVEEDETSPVTNTWGNNSLTKTTSHQSSVSPNVTGPELTLLGRRTTAPVTGMNANFYTPSSPSTSEHKRPELLNMDSFDNLRDDQIAAGTQRAAEHAQSTLANAAALAQNNSPFSAMANRINQDFDRNTGRFNGAGSPYMNKLPGLSHEQHAQRHLEQQFSHGLAPRPLGPSFGNACKLSLPVYSITPLPLIFVYPNDV
jgi:hypothetical protein